MPSSNAERAGDRKGRCVHASIAPSLPGHEEDSSPFQTAVGISDMAVSDDPGEELITYSLGSCLGVAIFDPFVRVGGMIHCMLPLSGMDKKKAEQKPCMFVDTGMTLLLRALFERGVRKARAVVKVAGASSVLDNSGLFRIGERNYAVLRKILWKNDMLIAAESVGGKVRRTLRLAIGTGRVRLKTDGRFAEL